MNQTEYHFNEFKVCLWNLSHKPLSMACITSGILTITQNFNKKTQKDFFKTNLIEQILYVVKDVTLGYQQYVFV